MEIKRVIPYLTVLGIMGGGVAWLFTQFTPLTQHEALAARVQQNELQSLRQAILSEVYFLRDQVRKYPQDAQLTQKLKEAESELRAVEKRMEREK